MAMGIRADSYLRSRWVTWGKFKPQFSHLCSGDNGNFKSSLRKSRERANVKHPEWYLAHSRASGFLLEFSPFMLILST